VQWGTGVNLLRVLQEIQDRFSQLLEERQHLHTAWQHKKVHLDQLIDLQFFLRDAKQIDALSSSQEVALAGTDIGTSVDEVDVAMKKHEAFEKLLNTQEEKVLALREHGDKLLAQNHFESGVIGCRMGEVVQRRVKVHELCVARRQRLEDALHHAQFVRDVAEVSHRPRWLVTRFSFWRCQVNPGSVPVGFVFGTMTMRQVSV
jgi:Spectrin repeat.